MKLKDLDYKLNREENLDILRKYIKEHDFTVEIYIFKFKIGNNTATINVTATSPVGITKYHVDGNIIIKETSDFIYSVLSDLEDIEWVDYHWYDTEKDLYYFGVEFKEEMN